MNVKYKGRYWACIVYPDSIPINWLEILQETGLAISISPLHDKDVNPDGVPKKPHYHVLFCYDGPTTYNNVKNLCEKINGTIPKKIESPRGMYRYFIHMDNPEKYQYDDRERIHMNGFDPKSLDGLTRSEVIKMKREIVNIIEDNSITEYRDLIKYFNEYDLVDFFEVASSSTLFINTYLNSFRNKKKLN